MVVAAGASLLISQRGCTLTCKGVLYISLWVCIVVISNLGALNEIIPSCLFSFLFSPLSSLSPLSPSSLSPPLSLSQPQDRQKALEDMGISVQESGIGVQTDKYYLINLNADPSMNELLVCYLKEYTRIGRPSHSVQQVSGCGDHAYS